MKSHENSYPCGAVGYHWAGVMKMVGLGGVHHGPAVHEFPDPSHCSGCHHHGPRTMGALLGGVFGAVSFTDFITGASRREPAHCFRVSPVNTFILCVGMRVLMGCAAARSSAA